MPNIDKLYLEKWFIQKLVVQNLQINFKQVWQFVVNDAEDILITGSSDTQLRVFEMQYVTNVSSNEHCEYLQN